ncbi:hypothetical protein Tco_1292390 [Tanacetum coccineum]
MLPHHLLIHTVFCTPSSLNPLPQQTTPTLTPITSEATNSFPALPDFSLVFKFNDRVTKLEQTLEEALADKKEYIDLVNTSVTTIIREEVKTQLPQILPQVVSDFATPVIEKNVTETIEDVILIDKMEETKSYQVADYKKELYNALVKSYNTDKDLFDSYGEVFSVKRGRDEKDKDQDPSARSDQGTKRRKTSKEGESSKDSSHNVDDSEMQQNQEFDTGHTEEQPDDKTATKVEWFKKPKRSPNLDRKQYPFDLCKPLPLIKDHRGCQVIPEDYFINNDLEYLKGGSLSKKYSTSVTKTKAATYELKWIEDLTSSKDVYSRRRIIAVTRLKIMKWYDYGHLDEIEVRRDDQQLYIFKEGDFPQPRLQDIEDMLLLLMYGDSKAGGGSSVRCPKLTKEAQPYQTRRIQVSDGTLNDVRTALQDISSGLRMDYLPKKNWSNLEKRRARVMVQDIEKQLFQR